MNVLARIAMLPLAALLVSATPVARVIPLPGDNDSGEALVIPADSPVHFRGWDKYGYAEFDGRFVLTGTFTYGCWSNCADYNGPVAEADLEVRIEPDAKLAARLPHWKIRNGGMLILIKRAGSLAAAITTSRQHAALRAGKIKDLRGQTSVIVDDFRTGIECDSSNFSARFVSIARAPKPARAELNGEYGCA